MTVVAVSTRLRITNGRADRWHGRPPYVAIVEKAKKRGLGGATVWKGIMGFGANGRLRERTVMSLTEDVPILIEIVDSDAKIRAFLSAVEGMIMEGVVTFQSAHQRVGRRPAAARP